MCSRDLRTIATAFFAEWCWHLSQASEGAAPVWTGRGADRREVISQDGVSGSSSAGLGISARLGSGWPPASAAAWGSGAGCICEYLGTRELSPAENRDATAIFRVWGSCKECIKGCHRRDNC